MSFNQIFREEILRLPPLGSINCHAGKLPFYRGRNILNWVLINDEPEFGITVHYIDLGIDTGDIILQATYPITDEDDYSTLLERAYKGCAELLYNAIDLIIKDQVERISQDSIDPKGSYCRMRKEGDEKFDFQKSSREIFNFVRALCKPGPMATCLKNETPVKINRVKVLDPYDSLAKPGEVIEIKGSQPVVKTLDGAITLIEFESSESLNIGDLLK